MSGVRGVWRAWLALAIFWTCFFFVFFHAYLLPHPHPQSKLQLHIHRASDAVVAQQAQQASQPEVITFEADTRSSSQERRENIICSNMAKPHRSSSLGHENGSRNLCLEGKLVPSLYVLGAQKAGTSSFASSFQSDDVCFAPSLDQRTNTEWNFFVWKLMQFGGLSSEAEERRLWLKKLPFCPDRFPVLLADDSPDNLALVPVPEGTVPLGFHWGPLFAKEFCHKPLIFKSWRSAPHCQGAPMMNLPQKLYNFYGPDASTRLAFLVLLRNPLERMHSAWYQALQQEFRFTCSDCQAPSFESALAKAIEAASGTPPSYQDWFWFSLYARHLEHWLSVFSPRQLYLVPMRYFLKCGTDVCNELSQFHHFQKDCSEFQVHNFPFAKTDRPNLQLDLGDYWRTQFDKIMAAETDLLVDTLWQAYQEGAHLLGFRPKNKSLEEVHEWIVSTW